MDSTSIRTVPRWLHVWAILTVIVTALLLVVGGFVTTFRVGMADPVWPTEPWYLLGVSWSEPKAGFLVEHTHRLLGFLVGGLASVLALGLWWTDRNSSTRWLGLAGLVALLATFGQFHRAMIKQADDPLVVWPVGIIAAMLVVLAIVLVLALLGWRNDRPAGGIRLLVVLVLVGVMIQGLLGGLRVRLNAIAGTDLAAVHGSFAQIVFALLIAVALLTGRVTRAVGIPPDAARKLRWQTSCLVLFTFIQIVWGAWIRHYPGPLSNRMHLFFAFVVVGFATLAIKQALSDPVSRERFKVPARFMMGLITIQVLLGIEAWMGKFLTGTLPEFENLTRKDADKAVIRTAHAHIGTWILAVAVIFHLLARRKGADVIGPSAAASVNSHDPALSDVRSSS
jgi:heme A synthase